MIPLNRDQTDAGYFAQFLREERVREIVHAIKRQAVRGDRQGKDRRIGGIDLVVFGRVRQVLRQKSAGNIDRCLYILRGDIDRPVEDELERDRRGPE